MPTRKRITRKHHSTSSAKHTYFIKSKYYPDSFIEPLFSSRGNWIKIREQDLSRDNSSSNTWPAIDFVWLDSKKFRSNPKYYQLPSRLINIVTPDRSSITRKDWLMANLARIPGARKYIIPQLNITPDTRNAQTIRQHITKFCKPGQIYIVKPVGGWLGTGIKIFSDPGEIIKYLLDDQTKTTSNWVIQQYITRPLLLTNQADGQNYKFHIRHYYVYQPRPRPSYYLSKGAFAIAKKPYVQGDWLNAEIHDTHFSEGEIWPDDMNPGLTPAQLSSVNKQIADMYSYLDSIIHAGCYKQNRDCFTVFGVDIMITDKLEVKLLEVNPNPGLDYNLSGLEGPLFASIMSQIVDKDFKPETSQPLLDDANSIRLIKIKRRAQTKKRYLAPRKK